MTQEEFDKKKKEQEKKRKARKNNGAKRDMHYEMKEVHVIKTVINDCSCTTSWSRNYDFRWGNK